MDETEYPKAKRKAITQGIRSIFLYAFGMFVFEIVTNFVFDGIPIKNSLLDLSNLITWLCFSIIFNTIFIFARIKRLKKALEHSQEE